jgi:hypothetical protein
MNRRSLVLLLAALTALFAAAALVTRLAPSPETPPPPMPEAEAPPEAEPCRPVFRADLEAVGAPEARLVGVAASGRVLAAPAGGGVDLEAAHGFYNGLCIQGPAPLGYHLEITLDDCARPLQRAEIAGGGIPAGRAHAYHVLEDSSAGGFVVTPVQERETLAAGTVAVLLSDPARNRVFTNAAAGYSFEYPDGFTLGGDPDRALLRPRSGEGQGLVAVEFDRLGEPDGPSATFEELALDLARRLCVADGPGSAAFCTDAVADLSYLNPHRLEARELHLTLVTLTRTHAWTAREEVLGPVYVFDASRQTGLPGAVIVIHARGGDGDSPVLRGLARRIAETLRFAPR